MVFNEREYHTMPPNARTNFIISQASCVSTSREIV